MAERRSSRLVALAAGAMLLALSASPVAAAGKPSPSIGFYVCWTGTTVYMQISWSRVVVDAYSFGFSDGEGQGGGFASPLPRKAASGTVTSISEDQQLTPGADAASVGGAISFRGTLVFEGSQFRPDNGWSAIGACIL